MGAPKDPVKYEQWRAKHSAAMRKMWSDPTKRAEMSRKMKEISRQPERLDQLRKAGKNPAHNAACRTIAFRTRASIHSKLRCSDPDYRLRLSEKAKVRSSTPQFKKTITQTNHIRWSNPQQREKMSILTRERWGNPQYRQDRISDIRAYFQKPEAISRHSDIMKDRIKKGYQPPGHRGKPGYHWSPKLQDRVHYRSKQELLLFKRLDSNPDVVFYRVEPVWISYSYRQATRNYLPDVLIYYRDGTQTLVEYKPELYVKEEQNLAKWTAAKAWCLSKNRRFEVWTEKRRIAIEEILHG
jgi:hypothetical protein